MERVPITLDARVQDISFQSAESGYTVLRAKDLEAQQTYTLVGEMPLVKSGEQLRFQGQWSEHPRFGRQFRVQHYESILPTGVEEIEAFLASGLIKGLGPKMAQRIVQHFGEQTLQILDQAPERLLEVPKIGKQKCEQIMQSWLERRGLQPIVSFLQQHGLAASLGPRLYQEYGPKALQVLQNQPYDLTQLWGIGFESADRFARQIAASQWQAEHPARLQAGLRHVLQQATRDGHLYLPLADLLERGASLLGVEQTALALALEPLFERQELVAAPSATSGSYDVYLFRQAWAEAQSAERLSELIKALEPPEAEAFEQWLAQYEQEQQIQLAPGQREAVKQAASSKVFILTGGPGTGKTTVSRAILSWFQTQKLRCKLASPTGRAARRLTEVTGEEALTIHRLLEYDPQQNAFQRDSSYPLSADLVLLDEVSMVDMSLFSDLLQALPDRARLILIGDSQQLPSVGPGAVLGELLASGVIPAVELSEIYRQAQASRMVQNAHQVKQGLLPALLPPTGKNRHEDAFFVACQSPEQTLAQLLSLVGQRLPAAGHDPSEIQVLCPMKRGPIGTQALNAALQSVLNPPRPQGAELQLGPRCFRPGDRVIQLKNNYEHEIFNGDLGKILQVDSRQRSLEVSFADKSVKISDDQLKELDHAYALTIHKSQGAEFPVVILVMSWQHQIMLQRNLIYTGMTRAQKLLILLGEASAIGRAVENKRLQKRYTRLGERLQAQAERLAAEA